METSENALVYSLSNKRFPYKRLKRTNWFNSCVLFLINEGFIRIYMFLLRGVLRFAKKS